MICTPSNIYYYELKIEFYDDLDIKEFLNEVKLSYLKKITIIPKEKSYEKIKRSTLIFRRDMTSEKVNYKYEFEQVFSSLIDDFTIVNDYCNRYQGKAEYTMFFRYNDIVFGDRVITYLSPKQMEILSKNNIEFKMNRKTYY